MGFFQDLKQDLSQTVNDLGVEDAVAGLNLEEETAASEDLFGDSADTDFSDLEAVLEMGVAALEDVPAGTEELQSDPVQADVDISAMMNTIDHAAEDSESNIEENVLTDFEQATDMTEAVALDISEEIPEEQENISAEMSKEQESISEEIPEEQENISAGMSEEQENVSAGMSEEQENISAGMPEEQENSISEADAEIEQPLNEGDQNLQEPPTEDMTSAAEAESDIDTSAAASVDTAVITSGMHITGDVTSSGNMDLIGSITGNIEILGKLTVTGSITGNSSAAEIYAESAQINGEMKSQSSVKIGQSSVVIGNIFATSAVIAGAVQGDIDVHGPVILDTTAIVMGNIKSKSVQINNGAIIEGMCSQCYADISPSAFFDDVKKNRTQQ